LEEIGVYVEGERLLKATKIGYAFKQDLAQKISTITAGITKFQIVNETWNGETFWMKAAITIDKKSLEESLRDKLIVFDYILSAEQKIDLQDFKGAIEDLNKAIKINPEYILAYHKRGRAKYSAKDFQGSIQDHSKVIALDPNHVLSYLGRAYAKDELGRYEDAIEDYSKVIELKGDYYFIILSWAYSGRALDKVRFKDYQGAVKDFSMSIENDSSNASIYFHRGTTKFLLNDNYGAIEDYTHALDLEDDYKYYHWRGEAKHALGEHESAIADYSSAIQLNPHAADSYENRGRAKLYLGDKKGGCLDLSKAGELGSKYAYEAIEKFCN
jgi:tetratricopeptide (TPR) repeat protein